MIITYLYMTVALLYPVKPLVVGTPRLKLIIRVEHVKGDTSSNSDDHPLSQV